MLLLLLHVLAGLLWCPRCSGPFFGDSAVRSRSRWVYTTAQGRKRKQGGDTAVVRSACRRREPKFPPPPGSWVLRSSSFSRPTPSFFFFRFFFPFCVSLVPQDGNLPVLRRQKAKPWASRSGSSSLASSSSSSSDGDSDSDRGGHPDHGARVASREPGAITITPRRARRRCRSRGR